jgi:hypothetical protein
MSEHQLLTAARHAALRVRTDRGAALGDAVQTCLVVPDEFRRVQDEYPILFRQTADRESFVALALLGFEPGENLFLGEEGWDARYLPLSMSIQPFLIGGAPGADGAKQVVIDLGSARVAGAEEGTRVFDAGGRPTPFLEATIEKLGALDAGYAASGAFFAALARHRLLEPFVFEVTLETGTTNRLVGFHVIDEDRLRELDSATLGELHAAGHLMPIFMAIASLGRLNALVGRKNKAVQDG